MADLKIKYGKNLESSNPAFEAGTIYLDIQNNDLYYDNPDGGGNHTKIGPGSKHTHTKGDVGLGNVDNTADSTKSVKYAATAGSASANDVHPWAKAETKPVYTAQEVNAIPADGIIDGGSW